MLKVCHDPYCFIDEDKRYWSPVLLKNISFGGAYTEYMNDQNCQLIEDLGVLPMALAVRMPSLQEPVVLDCEVKRIHATEGFVGVGLRFTNEFNDEWLPKRESSLKLNGGLSMAKHLMVPVENWSRQSNASRLLVTAKDQDSLSQLHGGIGQ